MIMIIYNGYSIPELFLLSCSSLFQINLYLVISLYTLSLFVNKPVGFMQFIGVYADWENTVSMI